MPQNVGFCVCLCEICWEPVTSCLDGTLRSRWVFWKQAFCLDETSEPGWLIPQHLSGFHLHLVTHAPCGYAGSQFLGGQLMAPEESCVSKMVSPSAAVSPASGSALGLPSTLSTGVRSRWVSGSRPFEGSGVNDDAWMP